MKIETDEQGGRIFFSSTGRSLEGEDEICILSVGVDIGSSTSHLVFSRIVLERLDSRYLVTEREIFYQSDILLTPYTSEDAIDADALGAFFEKQYENAMVDPDEIDAGALILTGVAVRRSNARLIGELFARQAGKLVAVSAGDGLETVMAAYGSGAVARSIRDGAPIMNVDVGGGTSKIAVCHEGRVAAITAVDVGARLVCTDAAGRITRLEEAGRRFGDDLGLKLEIGGALAPGDAQRLAGRMADSLFDAMKGGAPSIGATGLLRLDPLAFAGRIDTVTFSGGVSEYVYGWESGNFGDLGGLLAAEIRQRVTAAGMRLEPPVQGIRATVIGASQYTTQVSGSTIFVSPLDVLPVRNLPVIAPDFALDGEAIASTKVAAAIRKALLHLDLTESESPVAIFVPWQGSATFHRLDAFCRGVVEGLGGLVTRGLPVVLAGDSDVGGLLGIHFREEMKLGNPVISIDGLELKQFDYIDIGEMLESSGAVPVVIKSLVFPASAALGQEWKVRAATSAV
ncbi:MAG TPA: ethanolamine ammonia-lyase reactivating factor EutA [Xanthobacteraceae bacterium]|nr:ethanolamine ammonia-lyase reactivating factor EutA [Xanthobacteraceae bacterium]